MDRIFKELTNNTQKQHTDSAQGFKDMKTNFEQLHVMAEKHVIDMKKLQTGYVGKESKLKLK